MVHFLATEELIKSLSISLACVFKFKNYIEFLF